MTMIKNAKQLKAERNRLRLREVEAKEKIKADWKALVGSFGFNREPDKSRDENVPPTSNGRDEDTIIASTLAYAGALLGRKLGAKVEEKMSAFFQSENGKE